MKTLSPMPSHRTPSRRQTRDAQAPPKLFYRIQEAATLTDLKPSVLRYWETEFRELRPEKDASDQRRYRSTDIEVVQAIRKLLYDDGFTIKGARGKLREELRRIRGEAAETTGREDRQAVIENARGNGRRARPIGNRRTEAGRPSVTQMRLWEAETPTDDVYRAKVGRSLRKLRTEVNALLSMLA